MTDPSFIPPWSSRSRREWPRATNGYSAMDLYRACEARRFEEARHPVGTDRVMNDLMRLRLDLDQAMVDIADIENTPNTVPEDIENLGRELEELKNTVEDMQ